MGRNKVSVIIPAFNRADLLPESVGSVLSQDYGDIEVIVVDDGSSDNTEEVVRGFGERVRYLRQENAGASVARNLGILHSSGDYLMFLDSDDTLLDSAVRKLADALDNDPDYGAVYCGWIQTDGPGHVVHESPLDHPSGDVFVDMCTRYLCIVHSVMIRRTCLSKAGLFDGNLRMYEDMDFNIRIAADYRFVFIPERLVEYRVQHSQASSKAQAGLEKQRRLYLDKIRPYQDMGRLDEKQFSAVRRFIYGPGTGERCTAEAINAFREEDWRRALSSSAKSFVHRPRNLIRRTIWLIALRSLWRSMTGPRRSSDSGNAGGDDT